ncbi:UDP-glycosyltransferase 90A1-like [Camellia sinensis]|uniref:UDP-glycosyltransferase 90A1-like n=1 Tax=Camellia sinensis TaxID=4442 RepID=UPI001035738A|nr:UDP-glycosyltransferase 90A1-like [Camellia sinensis]
MASVSTPHFVIFPFMSQGHTIPLLNLARLLRHRHISFAIFTIPANSASIRDSLTNTGISIINLPFTEKLNSMSLFLSIANATKQMQPHFEQAIESLQSVSCIISDGFLTWTQQSAAKLGIPRLVFYGMSNYATTMSEIVVRERPHAKVSSDDEPFPVPDFPWLKLTRNDFEPPFSQADMSPEQLREIALGLEQAKVNFLWVLRSKGSEFWEGFEERVKDRGIIVKEWVDQLEILQHESINGFLSHCGWNSVVESISVGVPILALPLMAEQHLNARMLVEEIGIGLRLMPSNGSVRGFVKLEEVEKVARELMEGERGVAVRMKVKEVRKAACAAMKEGGSSSSMLNLLINEFGGPHP